MAQFDFAVASVRVHPALARHVDVDLNAMIAPADRDAVMREAHVNLDHVTRLVLFDPDAVFPDLVARGRHLGFDGVLVPGGNVDVGVGSSTRRSGLPVRV